MSAPGAVRQARPAESARPEPAGSAAPVRRRSRWDRRPLSSAGVWWLSPIGAVGLLCPLTILVSWQTPDRIFQADYKETKAVTGSTVLMATVALLAFAAGAGLNLLDARRPVTPASWPGWQPSMPGRLRRAEPVLFALTMAGYVLFAVLGAAHGLTLGLLVKSLVDQDSYSDNLTDVFGSVTGLTSFTQVGMAYSVVAMFVLVNGRDRRVRNRLIFLLLLALLRSYLVSERLAVIEVLVPVIAIGITAIAARGRGRGRRLARAAPLLMFPALFVGFGALEYSRSYAFYSARTHESLAGFTLHRLTGYYVTSFNNGQLSLDYDRFPGRLPFGLLQGFWTAPGIAQLGGYQAATGVDHQALFDNILLLHGNPEYNSPGGLAVPFVDLGLVGGFVFFFLLGLVFGALYRRYLSGDTLGLLVYPTLLTGMFELPRYVYWTEGRYLPSLAVLVILTLLSRRRHTSGMRPLSKVKSTTSERMVTPDRVS